MRNEIGAAAFDGGASLGSDQVLGLRSMDVNQHCITDHDRCNACCG
jgi:hypothetical protein